jgi:hypothetical protein
VLLAVLLPQEAKLMATAAMANAKIFFIFAFLFKG